MPSRKPGFAFDLGAEKFLDIKCRQSGLDPAAIVIVATARALKMHGGTALADLKNTDVAALKKGLANLDAHLDAAAHYKRPVVVAVNKFFDDSQEELDAIVAHCAERGIPCAIADIFSQGGEGGKNLAQMVVEAADKPLPLLSSPSMNPPFRWKKSSTSSPAVFTERTEWN